MFLTAEQLTELTDRSQPGAQIDWLSAKGYVFDVGASGRPKVLVSFIEKRLGGEKQIGKKTHYSPKFDCTKRGRA